MNFEIYPLGMLLHWFEQIGREVYICALERGSQKSRGTMWVSSSVGSCSGMEVSGISWSNTDLEPLAAEAWAISMPKRRRQFRFPMENSNSFQLSRKQMTISGLSTTNISWLNWLVHITWWHDNCYLEIINHSLLYSSWNYLTLILVPFSERWNGIHRLPTSCGEWASTSDAGESHRLFWRPSGWRAPYSARKRRPRLPDAKKCSDFGGTVDTRTFLLSSTSAKNRSSPDKWNSDAGSESETEETNDIGIWEILFLNIPT